MRITLKNAGDVAGYQTHLMSHCGAWHLSAYVLRQQCPTFLAPGTSFTEDNFSMEDSGIGDEGGHGGMVSGWFSALHLLCTLFLLLLHQLHLRSSGIRSQRLRTPVLKGKMKALVT